MEPLETIDALARRARAETTPATHMQIDFAVLQRYERQQSGLSPLAWSASASLVAACLVLMLALHSGTSAKTTTASADSVSALFTPVQVEMP